MSCGRFGKVRLWEGTVIGSKNSFWDLWLSRAKSFVVTGSEKKRFMMWKRNLLADNGGTLPAFILYSFLFLTSNTAIFGHACWRLLTLFIDTARLSFDLCWRSSSASLKWLLAEPTHRSELFCNEVPFDSTVLSPLKGGSLLARSIFSLLLLLLFSVLIPITSSY